MAEAIDLRHKIGVVVLCGGSSSRMGVPKWRLPVGDVTLLDHLIGKIKTSYSSVVVAGNSDQSISVADKDVLFVADENIGCGPLEGLRCGLKALSQSHALAFVTACDIPWFCPGLLEKFAAHMDGYDAVIPVIDDRVYGMTALYRTDCHQQIGEMVQKKSLRVSGLVQKLRTLEVDARFLKSADPELQTLQNINYPEDYLRYLDEIGGSCPNAIRDQLRG